MFSFYCSQNNDLYNNKCVAPVYVVAEFKGLAHWLPTGSKISVPDCEYKLSVTGFIYTTPWTDIYIYATPWTEVVLNSMQEHSISIQDHCPVPREQLCLKNWLHSDTKVESKLSWSWHCSSYLLSCIYECCQLPEHMSNIFVLKLLAPLLLLSWILSSLPNIFFNSDLHTIYLGPSTLDC